MTQKLNDAQLKQLADDWGYETCIYQGKHSLLFTSGHFAWSTHNNVQTLQIDFYLEQMVRASKTAISSIDGISVSDSMNVTSFGSLTPVARQNMRTLQAKAFPTPQAKAFPAPPKP